MCVRWVTLSGSSTTHRTDHIVPTLYGDAGQVSTVAGEPRPWSGQVGRDSHFGDLGFLDQVAILWEEALSHEVSPLLHAQRPFQGGTNLVHKVVVLDSSESPVVCRQH